MKKVISYFLMLFLVVTSVGCATVQKKFTRKKKEPKHIATALYFDEGPHQKQFSNEYYYKTHYTFWKTWHDDLITQLGGNKKKVERSAQESLGHLTEMNRHLVPEKQAELEPTLQEMSKLVKQIEAGYASSGEATIRYDLDRIRRQVANNFYFDKVKGFLLSDVVDLGGSPSS